MQPFSYRLHVDIDERPITGQRIVITGATNGIGKEIARALARRGAELTLVARNEKKAVATAKELSRENGATGVPDIVIGDLAELASVRRAAAEIRDRYDRIDVLVDNAGVNTMAGKTTSEGFDAMIATNHLGPFLFTNLLLDMVTGRIVVTASEGYRLAGPLELDRLGEPREYGQVEAQRWYGQSKLLNILFTQQLAQNLSGTGVTANCFCPGLANTDVGGDSRVFDQVKSIGERIGVVGSAERGAQLGIRLVLDTALDGVTGEFFTTTPGLRFVPAMPALRDKHLRQRAWDRSLAVVGL
jgi:NAD(P)-dependent dehydrogenase (short-subunit alcohol dehydrogenase family)